MDLSGIEVVNLPGAPAKTLATLAKRVPLPLARPLLRSQITGGRGDKLPSLLHALRNGHRRTEAAWLNGAVTKAADDIQRLAPVNHALALIVSDIAAGNAPWEMYRRRPDMLLTSIRVTRGM
jgi:ketopantoate reductase